MRFSWKGSLGKVLYFLLLVLTEHTCYTCLLKRMGIVDSDMCTFCKLIKEDVEHLFFHCPFSSSFWTDFEAFWSYNMNETVLIYLCKIKLWALTMKS